jgi:hypothetical protein
MDSKVIRTWMQVFITAILGIFCLGLVALLPDESPKLKWAFGIIGIIIGYWLK